MAEEQRYEPAQVGHLLDLAYRADMMRRVAGSGEDGSTLEEVQEIARELGIDPRRVAEIALQLQTRVESVATRRFLGVPISVSRVVGLPRPLSDCEWDVLASNLRDTFGVPGQTGTQAGAREWANGNLRVLLEPTRTGHQLRLSTTHGGMRFLAVVGAAVLVVGLVSLALSVPALISAGDHLVFKIIRLLPSLIVTAFGIGYLALPRLRLPGWAQEREAQMELVAAHASVLAATPHPLR
jgi:hypothetical protein